MLEKGMEAYKFELPDKDGNIVKLDDFKGSKVVVYFYPKDSTPGCTRQACSFRNNYGEYEKLGVKVIGISKDSVASHGKFATNNNLPFILLSDNEQKAIEGFGVRKNKILYGKSFLGVSRSSFVIDENGIIEKVFKDVKPEENPTDILDYLRGEKQ